MKSQEEAIKFIKDQMDNDFKIIPKNNRKRKESHSRNWYYGKVELSDLIDFIYENINKE